MGISTANLPSSNLIDSIVGNFQGGTRIIAIERLVSLVAALMGPSYATRAQLNADLAWPAGSIGYVRGDTAAINGVYKKTGNSGAGNWARIGDLPSGAVELGLITDEANARIAADDALRAYAGKIFPSRADAVSIGQAALPAVLSRIITIEDGALVFRGPNHTVDDPLFGSNPSWGVALRVPGLAALRDAGIIPLTVTGGVPNWPVATISAYFLPLASSIVNTNFVSIIPSATNTGPVSITIGGVSAASSILGADGQPLTGGEFAVGRCYILQRRGTAWRIVVGWPSLTEISLGVREVGTLPLENLGGTGDAWTADIGSEMRSLGITALGAASQVEYTPATSNTVTAVTAQIAGTTFSVRDAGGLPLTVGFFKVGRSYTLRRRGTTLRVVGGETTGADVNQAVSVAVSAEAGLRDTADRNIRTEAAARAMLLGNMARASGPSDPLWLAAQRQVGSWAATVSVDASSPITGTDAAVLGVSAQGAEFATQDTGLAAITRSAAGLRFSAGAWLRCIPTPIPAAKMLLVARLTVHAGSPAGAAILDTNIADLTIDTASQRLLAKVPGANLPYDIVTPFNGVQQTIAMMVDTDAQTATIIQRDGYGQVTALTAAAASLTDIRIGRNAVFTLHDLWLFTAPAGAPLPATADDLWARLAGQPPRGRKKASVFGGWGQSLYQAYPVPVAERQPLNEAFRLDHLRVRGLQTTAGAAVSEIGAGINQINPSVPATGLAPITVNHGETILFAIGRALIARRRALGLASPVIISGTNGFGGQAADEFDNDPTTGTTQTTLFANECLWREQGKACAVAAGYDVSLDFALEVHGTADKGAARHEYFGDATRVNDQFVSHALTHFGSAPKLLMTQSGGDADTTLDSWAVCLDQLDVVRHYDALLIGPLYPHYIIDDNVHPDHIERRLIGEIGAEAIVTYERGRRWNLLPPERQVGMVSGNQVMLPFDLPYGSQVLTVPEPTKYDAFGGFCANMGFEAPGRTITSVTMSGRVLTITLDAAPTRLRYAMQAQNVIGNRDAGGRSYTGHRGLIATDWAAPSATVPGRILRRWLPSFEIDFS